MLLLPAMLCREFQLSEERDTQIKQALREKVLRLPTSGGPIFLPKANCRENNWLTVASHYIFNFAVIVVHAPLVVPHQSLRIVIDYKWTIPAQFGIHLRGKFGSRDSPLAWARCSQTPLQYETFCPLPHPPRFHRRAPVLWLGAMLNSSSSFIRHRLFPEESTCSSNPIFVSASWKTPN